MQAEPGPDQKQQQKEQGNRQEEQGGTALLFKTIEIRQKIQGQLEIGKGIVVMARRMAA